MSRSSELIEVAEPGDELCPRIVLPPEGNVKLRNYRVLEGELRAYTPTGDVHTSPAKGKLVARYDAAGTVSPPRHRILELLRPEDPGRDALEAIVRPAPRRGLARPLDEDARRFLQRALLSPSPCMSESPEPVELSLAEELHAVDAGEIPRKACDARERLAQLVSSEPAGAGAGSLTAVARKLDALLAESRALHRELAAIHHDLQVLASRTSP